MSNLKAAQKLMQAADCCKTENCSLCPYAIGVGRVACKKILKDYQEVEKESSELLKKYESMKARIDNEYASGASDAWNVVKEIFVSDNGNGMSNDEIRECFNCATSKEVLQCTEPLEAIQQLEEYQKFKLEVGMIMENESKVKVVVLKIDGNTFDGYSKFGPYTGCLIKRWKYTGEKMDVSEFLSKLM